MLTGIAYRANDTLPDHLVLLKLDPAGAVLWERRFPKKNLNTNVRSVSLYDGGAVVLFNSQVGARPISGDQTQALRITANGDTLWQRHYFQGLTEPYNRSSNQFIALPDGTLLSIGGCSNCTGSVLRLNPSDGTMMLGKDIEIASNYHGRRATGGALAANGDLLVMSINYSHLDSVFLYRLSPEGAVLQRKGLKIGEYHYGSSLLRLSDGGLAAIVAHNFSHAANSPDGLLVRRLSEAFAPLGADMILANVERRPEDAAALPGGGLALVGFIQPSNSADVFLLKTSALPTVSTADVGGIDDALRLFPNPIAAGQPLQILLENDFFGSVKIEILSLDGRVLQVFEKEKTTRHLVFEVADLPKTGPFIVRISDGERSAARLVLKP